MPTTMAIRLTTIASARNWLESWWRVAPIALRIPTSKVRVMARLMARLTKLIAAISSTRGGQSRQQIDMLDRTAAEGDGSCYTRP